MAVVADESIIECRVDALQYGQSVQNVIHYRLNEIVPNVTLAMILQGFATVWRTSVITLLHDSYVAQKYTARVVSYLIDTVKGVKLRYSDWTFQSGNTGADTGGVDVGTPLPSNIAATITKMTAGPASTVYNLGAPPVDVPLKEKIFKGSLRIGGLPEAYTEDEQGNTLTAAAVTALQGAAGDLLLIDGVGGGGGPEGDLHMVILSLLQDKAPRPIAANPTKFTTASQDVTDVVLESIVGSQNTRKQRRTGA